LETRARIAADARGVARKILTRSRRPANAGRASFAGEKNYVFLDDGCAFCDRIAGCRSDSFVFRMLVFGVLVLGVLVFLVFVFVLVMLDSIVFTESRGVFRAFVRGVGFCFGAIGRAAFFHFLGFFFCEARDFCGMSFFRLFFGFVLFEFGATDDGIDFDFFRGFFVFGFDEISGQCGNLVFT